MKFNRWDEIGRLIQLTSDEASKRVKLIYLIFKLEIFIIYLFYFIIKLRYFLSIIYYLLHAILLGVLKLLFFKLPMALD